ncbi:Colicin-D [compost metagenome]
MADQGFVPGQPYEIKPLYIVAGRQQTFGPGGGGGYRGNGDGWGLQEGPHRGTGGPSGIHDIALPNVMAEFMNEQIHSQLLIDNEYSARFKTLFTDTERELEERKQAAKGTQALAPVESAAVDQKVALDLIDSKKNQYISIAPSIYGLYGQSPFFMMEVLPRQKMREFLNSGSADPQALMNLYAMFDNVYKSALELKALSLSMDVLAGKLVDLARQRNHAESVVPANDAAWQAAQDQRLGIIVQERDIHVQQLPEFLQTELAAVAGSVAGLTPSQALTHYKATLDRMAATKTAEIKPIQAPPPFRRNGLTITFPAANPNINAPLSKPELEALNELVYLQTNTPVGIKWLSYHDALLKAESARYLTATSNAFGGLAERSNEAEQIAEAKRVADEQARIAAEAEAKRVADEQARVAAEAEAQRVAAEAEAKRVADEQARIAAEAEAKRVVDEQARIAAEAQAVRAANTFRIPAATGTVQLSAAAGSIALTPGSALTLDLAIERAIALFKLLKDAATVETAAGLASRWIPFAALVWPSSLGNSDLYPSTALSLPAKTLAPDLAQNLPEIAAAGGTVDVPYRIYGDCTKYSVIATQASGGVSPKVPVRALMLDPALNGYTFTTTETPPRTLIFPIASPGTSTSTTPAVPAETSVYTGVTLTPIEVEAETLPAVDQLDIRDCIYCFPADSGLPPIYVVFSESLDSGKFTRKQLDRKFKHAKSFGITDNRKNAETLTKLRDAIDAHLTDAETIQKGTYQREKDSKVFFNQKTNNVVILDKDGRFVSGWKLDPNTPQFNNYIDKGVLQ